MAKYVVLFPVAPRTEGKFTREEIELAARIAFWNHPGSENTILDQDLVLDWSEEYSDRKWMKLIQVSGDVIPGEESGSGWPE